MWDDENGTNRNAYAKVQKWHRQYGTNDKQAILAYIIHVQKWHNGTIIIFLNL